MIGDSKPSFSNFHCNPVASALKPPQATKYPAAKIPVGIKGRPPAFSLRFARANSSSIGAALGSIMAAIIAHHITNIRPAYPRVHAAGTIMPAMPGTLDPRAMSIAVMPVPAPSRIQIQAIVITATRAATTTARSRRSTDSRTVASGAVIALLQGRSKPVKLLLTPRGQRRRRCPPRSARRAPLPRRGRRRAQARRRRPPVAPQHRLECCVAHRRARPSRPVSNSRSR